MIGGKSILGAIMFTQPASKPARRRSPAWSPPPRDPAHDAEALRQAELKRARKIERQRRGFRHG